MGQYYLIGGHMEEEVNYIHIPITDFKLWHSVDALATAHLTVIVS